VELPGRNVALSTVDDTAIVVGACVRRFTGSAAAVADSNSIETTPLIQ